MQAGAGHGGIKPFIYAFLSELGRMDKGAGLRFQMAVHCDSQLLDELPFPIVPAAAFGSPDVLYSPFGYSTLMEAGTPAVAVVVDVLHRELPGALPIEEVHLRESQFQRLVGLPRVRLQCISKFTEECMRRHYGVPPERCFQTALPIHDRLPHASNKPAHGPPDPGSDPFFLYPANFWPHKNHEVLLIAHRLHRHSAPLPWRLVLTGHEDARCAQIREMAAGLMLGGHIRIAGHLDEPEFASLWSRAGALIFPSLHEGFAIPLLEAMHFGVPILASNAAAIPETAGGAALLVDAGSPLVLADGLNRIAADAGLRGELVARGRQRLARLSLQSEVGKLADQLEAAARAAVS